MNIYNINIKEYEEDEMILDLRFRVDKEQFEKIRDILYSSSKK